LDTLPCKVDNKSERGGLKGKKLGKEWTGDGGGVTK